MTTPTDDLAAALSSRRRLVEAPQPEAHHDTPIDAEATELPPHDAATGEIVPVADAQPAEYSEVIHYPEIPPKVVGGLPYAKAVHEAGHDHPSDRDGAREALRGRPDAIMAAHDVATSWA